MARVREVAALRARNGPVCSCGLIATAAIGASLGCAGGESSRSSPPAAASRTSSAAFAIEEATIDGIQTAIKSGQTTCQAIVQAYIDRARVYNGVCTSLVTADGADIPPSRVPLKFGDRPIACGDHARAVQPFDRLFCRSRDYRRTGNANVVVDQRAID
jgi:uncharacterized membrane protein